MIRHPEKEDNIGNDLKRLKVHYAGWKEVVVLLISVLSMSQSMLQVKKYISRYLLYYS